MMLASEFVKEVRDALTAADLYNQNEMNVLFETALDLRPYELDDSISDEQADTVRALLKRRLGGEPLQYIAGRWPFLNFELQVGEGVLIPRPETEYLALRAIETLRVFGPKVLDLCSGSGCIPIAIKRARPDADVTAMELSEDALVYLRRNAKELCGEIKIEQGDVFTYQQRLEDGQFDLITANPPYVTPADYEDNIEELAHEPRMAFLGGEDGLDFYRHIAPAYLPKLKAGGCLIFETGFDQTDAVAELMQQAGYSEVEIVCDPFGLPRNVIGQR